jgi:rhamnosyltransferase
MMSKNLAPTPLVTVAIPVLNGGRTLAEVLGAVGAQVTDREIEVLICDSGSTDGSVELARSLGARVIEIPKRDFSHGGTRNLLMREAAGAYVAFLTQDATPHRPTWLGCLLNGFELSDDVALVHGPYLPRQGAEISVIRELSEHFTSLAPDGKPVVDRASDSSEWADVSSRATFFTDANGAVARWAWERVPFPDVAYAEDRLLAKGMLQQGFSKVFEPRAAVVHSHDYGSRELFGRYFDEFRGLRETFGHVESASPRRAITSVRRKTTADHNWALQEGAHRRDGAAIALRAARYHTIRVVAAALGSRADRLSPAVRRALSLERRDSFLPTN